MTTKAKTAKVKRAPTGGDTGGVSVGGVEIYALLDPLTMEMRYIGKANNSDKRLKTHIRDSRRRHTPVYCWIRKLTDSGLVPIVKVMEVVGVKEDWRDVERRLISQHSSARLLNLAEGGDEPYCSTEQRAKNARTNAAAIHGDPLKKKIWRLKKDLGDSLRWLKTNGLVEKHNEIAAKMKVHAIKNPKTFGAWMSLELI